MAKVVGIDPGTGSMDILGFDDESGYVFLEKVIPRDEVTRNPRLPLDIVERAAESVGGLDAVVAPSGYGLPLKRASQASEGEICEATFIHHPDETEGLKILGLRRLMALFASTSLPAWFTPGVIHLPTVPPWRKAGRIDMGTADKVFTVAAALRAEVELHGRLPEEASFVAVEAGLAYTAAIAVKNGAIVDGVGGTSGFPGFLGGGFMDAETAYAISSVKPRFSKAILFKGGAASLAGLSSLEELETVVSEGSKRGLNALAMLSESIVKDVLAVSHSIASKSLRVYVSGRLFASQVLGPTLRASLASSLEALGLRAEILEVPRLGSETKEGATGAALIASGLAGGRYSWLIDTLRLRESSGSIFDHIALPRNVVEAIKLEFRSCRPLGPG